MTTHIKVWQHVPGKPDPVRPGDAELALHAPRGIYWCPAHDPNHQAVGPYLTVQAAMAAALNSTARKEEPRA